MDPTSASQVKIVQGVVDLQVDMAALRQQPTAPAAPAHEEPGPSVKQSNKKLERRKQSIKGKELAGPTPP